MTLTIGTAPFGLAEPDGGSTSATNAPPRHVLYFEGSPPAASGSKLAGRVVADSRNKPSCSHETGHLPVYYFPVEDVGPRRCLEPSDPLEPLPVQGRRLLLVGAGGQTRVVENAVWGYPDPIDSGSADRPSPRVPLGERWTAGFEEDDEIHGHPPATPTTRVDVRESSRHVRVSLDGQQLAETIRPKLLFETSLPTRVYVPREDVRSELLEESTTATYCPYKGHASYWSSRAGDGHVEDVAWSYSEALPFPGGRPHPRPPVVPPSGSHRRDRRRAAASTSHTGAERRGPSYLGSLSPVMTGSRAGSGAERQPAASAATRSAPSVLGVHAVEPAIDARARTGGPR